MVHPRAEALGTSPSNDLPCALSEAAVGGAGIPERSGLVSGPESCAKKRCTCSGLSGFQASPTIPSRSSVHATTGVPTGNDVSPSSLRKQNTLPPRRSFFPSVVLYVVADGQSDSFVDASA